MKLFIIFALCLSGAVAGRVDIADCATPPTGMLASIDIDGCEGASCDLIPGTSYACDANFVLRDSAPSLHLLVKTHYFNTDIVIVDVNLENSAVEGGLPYSIKYTIIPSNQLVGAELNVQTSISDTTSAENAACGVVKVHIK